MTASPFVGEDVEEAVSRNTCVSLFLRMCMGVYVYIKIFLYVRE